MVEKTKKPSELTKKELKDILKDKTILDACCSSRMFWIDKNNKNTLYIDIREVKEGFRIEKQNFNIKPDLIADFRDLYFIKDNTFNLIVWDPPHLIDKKGMKHLSSIMTKKYGALHAETWRDDLKKGFNELFRVLKPGGTLIFKFADNNIQFEEVLKLFHTKSLFGTTTKQKNLNKTKWFCFYKI